MEMVGVRGCRMQQSLVLHVLPKNRRVAGIKDPCVPSFSLVLGCSRCVVGVNVVDVIVVAAVSCARLHDGSRYVKPIMFSAGIGVMDGEHAVKGEPAVGMWVVKVSRS